MALKEFRVRVYHLVLLRWGVICVMFTKRSPNGFCALARTYRQLFVVVVMCLTSWLRFVLESHSI